MNFAYFAVILASLYFNQNVVVASAMNLEKYPSPNHVGRSNFLNGETESGIADPVKAALLRVRMFSVLKTYAEVLERSLGKLEDFVGPETNMEPAVRSPYSDKITKEINFMIDFSQTSLNTLLGLGSTKTQQRLPEKTPAVTDIAAVIFEVGESFKPFWSRISLTYRLTHDDPWLSILHEIVDIHCEIIQCSVHLIKELIPELLKHFSPEFHDFNNIGFGLEKISQVLSLLH